ncbi:HD domain-containing phosphohydrolase [Limnobacter sp.]|uniref:HD domain-containing phosphohydrolase n=1 Tax=Limnobacter sp. TaxID=2003368 RepID=UPI003517D700
MSSELREHAVLIIDDEPNVLNALRRTLRSEPYRLESTTDPLKALEIAKTFEPDLVLCDMRMPGLNGAEVFAALSRSNPKCTKILLTGYADMRSTIAAINQGQIDRYMTKPWNDDDLKQTLQQQLRLVALRNERDLLAQRLTAKVKDLNALNADLDQRVAARTQELYQTNLFLEQAFGELSAQFMNAVKVFSNLIEMSAPGMAGHHRRVADLARLLALELDLPDAEVRDIYIAGLLHDVGKAGLSEHVFQRALPELEPGLRAAMIKHPMRGQAALLPLPELNNAALYIRQHHERVDGQGFPDGLVGDEISRGARILAVAEDWDELQLGWLLSRKLNPPEAMEHLLSGAGKRYDTAVLAALPAALARLEDYPADHEELLDSQALVPGMVLSRDLYNRDGLMLICKGTVLNSKMTLHLQRQHAADGQALKVYCKRRLH